MYFEVLTSYLLFSHLLLLEYRFWASDTGSGEGTLILVDDPRDLRSDKGYQILHSFWWMKHFSSFIRPGFLRVPIDNAVQDVLSSAWTGPNGRFNVIHINTSREYSRVTMNDLPEWVQRQTNSVWYSTLEEGFTYGGGFIGDEIWLQPRSITTIDSRQ